MPEFAVRCTLSPEQKVVGPDVVIEAVGEGSTTIVAIAVSKHPRLVVPVTVYTVVTDGAAVTTAPVVDDKPAEGDQV